MEMADLIAITKTDGDNIKKSQVAKVEYESALHLYPLAESGWNPPVLTCSSRDMMGINEIWSEILNYEEHTKGNNFFVNRRRNQSKYWMYETINEALRNNFYNSKDIQKLIPLTESKVLNETITSFAGANELLDGYLNA